MPTHAIPRRRFLKSATAGIAVAAAGSAAAVDNDDDLVIIDCHAHIYGTDENRYPTVPEPYRPPKDTGTVAHLRREMGASGVKYVTAIQTSSYYRWDNRFTADSSRKHSQFMAGVVTLDPDNPQTPWVMAHLVERFNARGMRSIPAASGRLDDPGVDALWATAERLGIVINVLTGREKLAEIEALIGRHPKLRIVIDHCLNLRIGPELEPTLEAMQTLAKHENVHAKLTFIPTGTKQPFPCRDLHDACHTVIKAFGPDRCVWGSDFPCELWLKDSKVTYAQHLRIFTHELGLDRMARRDILGRTAFKLWFVRRR